MTNSDIGKRNKMGDFDWLKYANKFVMVKKSYIGAP